MKLPSEVFKQKGWCRGALFRDGYSKQCYRENSVFCCVTGGIELSDLDKHEHYDYLITFVRTLKELGMILITEEELSKITRLEAESLIILWNDYTCKSKEELVAILKEVEQELDL